jgi:hypothetical protein
VGTYVLLSCSYLPAESASGTRCPVRLKATLPTKRGREGWLLSGLDADDGLLYQEADAESGKCQPAQKTFQRHHPLHRHAGRRWTDGSVSAPIIMMRPTDTQGMDGTRCTPQVRLKRAIFFLLALSSLAAADPDRRLADAAKSQDLAAVRTFLEAERRPATTCSRRAPTSPSGRISGLALPLSSAPADGLMSGRIKT